jgi:hypothetical protein
MRSLKAFLGVVALVGAGTTAQGAIAITSGGTAYTLNFNNLNTNYGLGYNSTGGSSPFPTNNTTQTTPVAVYVDNATPTFTTSGNDYSPGGVYSNTQTYSNSNAYRALQDGSNTTDLAIGMKDSTDRNYVLRLTNSTGATITKVDISYVVEQYSQGASATQVYINDYSLNSGTNFIATNLSGGSAVTSVTGTDGNLANVLSTSRTATITESIAPGGTLWIRWFHDHATGTSNHVGLDDISVTATVPEPASAAMFGAALIGLLAKRRTRG